MIPEFALSAVLAVVVLGGLAFHGAVVDRIASMDRDPMLTDPEDLD